MCWRFTLDISAGDLCCAEARAEICTDRELEICAGDRCPRSTLEINAEDSRYVGEMLPRVMSKIVEIRDRESQRVAQEICHRESWSFEAKIMSEVASERGARVGFGDVQGWIRGGNRARSCSENRTESCR